MMKEREKGEVELKKKKAFSEKLKAWGRNS